MSHPDRKNILRTAETSCLRGPHPALASCPRHQRYRRVGAAGLSLGLTSGAMVWAGVPHPPAGATTLIVSLGILRQPAQLVVLMVAVALLVVQAFVINRLAGIEYPVWSPASP